MFVFGNLSNFLTQSNSFCSANALDYLVHLIKYFHKETNCVVVMQRCLFFLYVRSILNELAKWQLKIQHFKFALEMIHHKWLGFNFRFNQKWHQFDKISTLLCAKQIQTKTTTIQILCSCTVPVRLAISVVVHNSILLQSQHTHNTRNNPMIARYWTLWMFVKFYSNSRNIGKIGSS